MKNKKESRWFTWVKAVTTIAVFVFLAFKLEGQGEEILAFFPVLQERLSWQYFLLILLLMPFNWGLEITKWKLLVSSHTSLTWAEASRGVLSGLAMGFVTPHAVGDYFGRLVSVRNGDPWVLGGMIMFSRSAQMLATLCFGVWGLVAYYQFGLYAILGGGLLLIFSIYILFRLLKHGYKTDKISRFLWVFRTVPVTRLATILVLSFSRYVVFAVQLAVAIHVIALVPWFDAFPGTTWILLIKSIAPAFNFLSDLGVREVSAIIYFEKFGYDVIPVIGASLLIWLVNILLPTLYGLYAMWRK